MLHPPDAQQKSKRVSESMNPPISTATRGRGKTPLGCGTQRDPPQITRTKHKQMYVRPATSSKKNQIRNRKRCQRRKTKKKYDPPKKREMKILQHNVAGLKTRMVETLKRAHRLKVDAMAIQECNFSVKRLPGDKIDHVIPKMKGFNVEAAPRKRGRKNGTDSKSKGGVAWAIKEGINYQRIDKSPIAPNDDTTEWVGIRIFPEDGTEPLDLYNIYVPPIHDGDKDDDRVQNFDQDYLPSSFSTFIFADANCHGTWDARGKTSQMAKNWEEWTDNNSMSILNKDLSYTR